MLTRRSSLTPQARLSCLIARAFTLGSYEPTSSSKELSKQQNHSTTSTNNYYLRPSQAVKVVAACRSLHDLDFLTTSPCRKLVENATSTVLASSLSRKDEVYDLVQLLWFVASPIHGRSADFQHLSTSWKDSSASSSSSSGTANRPYVHPFDKEFKKLIEHTRSVCKQIVAQEQNPNRYLHIRTDAVRSVDISHFAAAICRGVSLRSSFSSSSLSSSSTSSGQNEYHRQQHQQQSSNTNENNNNNTSSSSSSSSSSSRSSSALSVSKDYYFSPHVVCELNSAWCIKLLKEKDSFSVEMDENKRQHENQRNLSDPYLLTNTKACLLGGSRMIRCLAFFDDAVSSGEIQNAVDLFTKCFSKRMLRKSSSYLQREKQRNQQQHRDLEGTTHHKTAWSTLTSSTRMNELVVSSRYTANSLFENELVFIARALVRIFVISSRPNTNLTKYDRFTVRHMYNFLWRRFQVCTRLTQCQLHAPLKALKSIAIINDHSKDEQKKGKNENNNNTSGMFDRKIITHEEKTFLRNYFADSANAGKLKKIRHDRSAKYLFAVRLLAKRRRRLAIEVLNDKKQSANYVLLQNLADREAVTPRWVLRYLPTTATNEDTAVALFLSSVSNEVQNSKELKELLLADNSRVLNCLVAHITNWIEFSASKKTFHGTWGFGKPLRQILMLLAKLFPMNEQKQIIAENVQRIMYQVFLKKATASSSSSSSTVAGGRGRGLGGLKQDATLAFVCDMLRMMRWSCSKSMWIDQQLLALLLEEATRACSVAGSSSTSAQEGGGGGGRGRSGRGGPQVRTSDIRAAAEIVYDLALLGVDAIEARSVTELLLHSDLSQLGPLQLNMLDAGLRKSFDSFATNPAGGNTNNYRQARLNNSNRQKQQMQQRQQQRLQPHQQASRLLLRRIAVLKESRHFGNH